MKTIKYTLSFYIAPKIENEILQCIDDKNKIICYINTVANLSINRPIEKYIKKGIERARKAYDEDKADFWIAAVRYMDNLFKEKEDSILFVDNEDFFEIKTTIKLKK